MSSLSRVGSDTRGFSIGISDIHVGGGISGMFGFQVGLIEFYLKTIDGH
jgi:hypothetical protein